MLRVVRSRGTGGVGDGFQEVVGGVGVGDDGAPDVGGAADAVVDFRVGGVGGEEDAAPGGLAGYRVERAGGLEEYVANVAAVHVDREDMEPVGVFVFTVLYKLSVVALSHLCRLISCVVVVMFGVPGEDKTYHFSI